jgi:hypothetical protein
MALINMKSMYIFMAFAFPALRSTHQLIRKQSRGLTNDYLRLSRPQPIWVS